MKINVETTESSLLLVPSEANKPVSKVKNEWFNADYWASQQRLVGQSNGRNITWFIRPEAESLETEPQSSDWVLRHYYRGGMATKMSRDKFFFTGILRTRPYKEIKLLMEMREMGLPVPNCVAARVVKSGLSYSADLLMEKIVADDLVKCLTRRELSQPQWQNIGRVIAEFHQKGVYHADLNAHNIMIDQQQKVWLIDFDRCQIKRPMPKWQQQNISRLQRSLLKEKGIDSSLKFDGQCWRWLTASYNQQINNS